MFWEDIACRLVCSINHGCTFTFFYEIVTMQFVDLTRPRKRKASAISSENDDNEPPMKKQRCASDFAFCAPSGFDDHPPASPVPERKGKGKAETLVSKVEDSRACYEKPGPEEKIAAKKRPKPMQQPTSANATAKSSKTLSMVASHQMLSLRRALRCVREAAAAKGARKAISVEDCGEASRSRTPASSAAGADGGFTLRLRLCCE